MAELDLTDVLYELQELRDEVTRLQDRLDQKERLRPSVSALANKADLAGTQDPDGNDAVSRRHALRTAGIVAAGAIAGGTAILASAGPAAAASGTFDGNPAVTAVGSPAVQANTTSATQTAINAVAGFSDSTAVFGSAVGANSNGVIGEGTVSGVVGRPRSGGVTGVLGDASLAGNHGIRGLGSNSAIGVRGESSYIAVNGAASSTGIGVYGESSSGPAIRGAATSGRGGTFESATGVGMEAFGGISATYLNPISFTPTTSSTPYAPGCLTPGPGDVLWYCVEAGTPGKWRTLAAPNSAGAFYAVTPARVYDSRLSTYPQNGILGSGQNRTISVANSFDVNGALVTTNFIPAGASAVFANVTVVDTVGAGYLAVNPGGTTAVSASTINWSANGQILANGISLTLNATRQITVVNGSGGATQFIVDITGYWL